MPSYRDLTTIWKNIKEFELQPIRQAALRELHIVLFGAVGSGRHALANQMRTDPSKPELRSSAPLAILDLERWAEAERADLIILFPSPSEQDFPPQLELAQKWIDAGKKLIIFCNSADLPEQEQIASRWRQLPGAEVLFGSVQDREFLNHEFVITVLKLLPHQHLALGRMFPIFRLTIARQLISEVCLTNASYAFSTGLAEIVPVLALPLSLTDMVVLTKNQAFLVYRLGLLFGFSTHWQDYIAEFGSVIGGGFLWRQLARYLVGLIPAWGIVPKVAVAYSGTYAVGQAVLQWYLTGRHLSRKELSALYRSALKRGKQTAERLTRQLPHPRLPKLKRKKAPASLPEGKPLQPKQPHLGRRKPKALTPPPSELVAPARNCPRCGRTSAPDANYCQYCGEKL